MNPALRSPARTNPAKEFARDAFWAAKEREAGAHRAVSSARREALIARLRVEAAWKRASVHIEIAPDAHIGPGVRVTLDPGTSSQLRIGSGAILDGRARIRLRGGSVTLGARSVVREDVVLNVSGTFDLGEASLISYGTVVHCAERVSVGPLVGIAEYVTIVDSTHFHTERDVRHFDNVRTRPVFIGRNSWLCPKVTVTSGVTVGDYCIVGAGVTVTKSVPDAYSIGQGQTIERRRKLPWDAMELSA